MSGLTVIGLCVFGIVLVYVGVPFLPISRHQLSTKTMLRIFGSLAVVLIVGMAWTQQAALDAQEAVRDSDAALARAEDAAYRTCLQRNDTIEVNIEIAEARIQEAERDVTEDEDLLAEAKSDPPTRVEDIPVIEDIEDPAVQELLGILAAQSLAEYEADVSALEEHLEETKQDLKAEQDAKAAYESAAGPRDCAAEWPGAAHRENSTG